MTDRSVSTPGVILATAWLGLGSGVIIIMSSTFSVLFSGISTEFGWNRGTLSGAYSLFSLTSTLALPFIGRLVDRYGARAVIVSCVAAFATLTLLLRYAGSLWVFYGLFILIGLASGGTSTLPYFKVLVEVFSRRRGLALGIANSGTAVGTFLFPMAAQRLNTALGWRDTYLIIGCGVALITIPIVLRFMPARRSGVDVAEDSGARAAGSTSAMDADTAKNDATAVDSTPESEPGVSLTQAMGTSAFWIIGLAFFTATTALVGYLIHAVPLLKDRGMPAETAALAASVFGAAQFVGRLGAGLLLDSLTGGLVAAGLWITAALAFCLLWSGATGTELFVCTALIGMAFGGEGDVLAFMVRRLYGSRSFGRIYSVLLMINLLGAVAGPYLYGAAFDSMGSYTPILGSVAISTLAAAAVMAYLGYPRRAGPLPNKSFLES